MREKIRRRTLQKIAHHMSEESKGQGSRLKMKDLRKAFESDFGPLCARVQSTDMGVCDEASESSVFRCIAGEFGELGFGGWNRPDR
jgi:hypothetical protein